MRRLGEVAHTVPLGYQPTQLPGGPLTRPEGALLPLPPYTVHDGACLHLRVYTCHGVHGYKIRRKTQVLLDRGAHETQVIGNHILP